jgi:hypothetical protein
MEQNVVEELDDGSAIVSDPETPEVESVFDENLAETLNSPLLLRLGQDLVESVELDKEARKKRDKQYEEGLRRTGLGDDAPGGADFEGASDVVHPVLAEACVDFESFLTNSVYDLIRFIENINQLDIGEKIDVTLYNELVYQLILILQIYKPDMIRVPELVNLKIIQFDVK